MAGRGCPRLRLPGGRGGGGESGGYMLMKVVELNESCKLK
jgi:hypothetical protein